MQPVTSVRILQTIDAIVILVDQPASSVCSNSASAARWARSLDVPSGDSGVGTRDAACSTAPSHSWVSSSPISPPTVLGFSPV